MSLLIQIILLTRKRESEISFDIEESPFDLHHTQDQEYTDLESYSKKIRLSPLDGYPLGLWLHSGPENLKKSRPKKLVKSNKTFLTKFHFLLFQKWPIIHFWTGKKFKKLIYIYSFDFTCFFGLDFFKFSGPALCNITPI